MSFECRRKVASSARSPSSDPMKIAGSPHRHPAIQARLLSERRGIVAQVRRQIWKNFPERRAVKTRSDQERSPAGWGTNSIRPGSWRLIGGPQPGDGAQGWRAPRKGPGEVARKAPQAAFRSPLARQTFFQIFCREGPSGASGSLLTGWNRGCFLAGPLCDDLLTIGVDRPEGGAYNPNH